MFTWQTNVLKICRKNPNDFKPQRFHSNDALTNITRSKPSCEWVFLLALIHIHYIYPSFHKDVVVLEGLLNMYNIIYHLYNITENKQLTKVLSLSVSDEGYSRNASCTPNTISMFLLLVKQIDHWNIHKKNSNEVPPPHIAITV